MTTRKLATVALTFSVFNNLPKRVQSNGYMLEPPSRSYIASTEDFTWPECVSSGVCGLDALIKFYDSDWTDHKRRSPVPFASQRTYLPGNTIEVRSRLTNQHKAGHVELRGCPDGQDSVQECFERFKFEFVDDAAFGMPQDPSYPDRGYFWGGENASDYEFVMTFRIPDDLVGLETIIQWKYVDASECNPPGYSKYFRGQNSKNELLPDTFWSADNLDCKADKLAEADTDDEHYWNSAEVTIVKKNELDRKSDQVRRIQNEFPSLDHVIGLDDSHLLPKSTSTLRFNSLRGSSYISPEDKDTPPHDH